MGLEEPWKSFLFRSFYLLVDYSGSTVLNSLHLDIKIQACLPRCHGGLCKVKHFPQFLIFSSCSDYFSVTLLVPAHYYCMFDSRSA